MSDETSGQQWPNEQFRAKHDASGSPVTVTPVAPEGEFQRYAGAQPLKVEGETPFQDKDFQWRLPPLPGTEPPNYWADADEVRREYVERGLTALGLTEHEIRQILLQRSAVTVCSTLLRLVDQLSARIAKIEGK